MAFPVLKEALIRRVVGIFQAEEARASGGHMTQREEYLGDGLYASFDGYQIRLRAPRENGVHAEHVVRQDAAWAAINRLAKAFPTRGRFDGKRAIEILSVAFRELQATLF
jgi:hypothetical protein